MDRAGLERLALRYVERYATTRAKLALYLRRKIRERGWGDEQAPPVDEIVGRFSELRYVDDALFARMRGEALMRRGYGRRRLDLALRSAGIEAEDAAPALDAAEAGAYEAALAFARRRRIGPFGSGMGDIAKNRKDFAAMARAGHSAELIKKILAMQPEEV